MNCLMALRGVRGELSHGSTWSKVKCLMALRGVRGEMSHGCTWSER